MIPLSLQLTAITASTAYIVVIWLALRRSRLSVRQALLWLISGALYLACSLYPQPLLWAALAIGFEAPSNALFAGWLLTLTGLLFYQSLTTSQQSHQIKRLCQEIAIINQRMERLTASSSEPLANVDSPR